MGHIYQFSHSVTSDSLRLHGLQDTRLPCTSPTSRASQIYVHWVNDAIWPFMSQCYFISLNDKHYKCHILCHPLLLCPQSFPASGFFLRNQFFTSRGQNIEASASASVLLMNIQDWYTLGLTGLIALQSKGLSRVFSNTTVQKHQFFNIQLSL